MANPKTPEQLEHYRQYQREYRAANAARAAEYGYVWRALNAEKVRRARCVDVECPLCHKTVRRTYLVQHLARVHHDGDDEDAAAAPQS